MNLTAWVDVAIGLTLVYLGASLFVTVINEYVAQVCSLRAKQLCDSLRKLINDPKIQERLKKNPALQAFFDGQPSEAGSYVDPNILARLLIGGLAAGVSADGSLEGISEAIAKMPNSSLKTQLRAILRTTGTKAESLVETVSQWVDRSLTMLGEGYKRKLQWISFGVGLGVAIGLNLDTVTLTGHLYRDKEAREAAVALGAEIAERTNKETFDKCMVMQAAERGQKAECAQLTGLADTVQARNASLGALPIGWGGVAAKAESPVTWISGHVWLWGSRLIGWLLTALAISLGAPFWFDLLNKLVNIRHGMRRPEVEQARSEPAPPH